MSKLADVGQMIMDAYYRDYATDEDFLKLIHFKYVAGIVYGWLQEQDYKEQRTRSRQDKGYTEVNLSPDFLITETAEVSFDEATQLYKITPKFKPYAFDAYDEYGYGIQDVQSVKGDFVRMSYKGRWKLKRNPISSKTFWFNQSGVVFLDKTADKFKKVSLLYAPDVLDPAFGEDGGDIAQNKEYPVFTMALDNLRRLRDGQVVDMTNNSNPNSVMSTEISNSFQALRNKPI